ncbi:hypothetical protein [Tahibacter amnicola]|uniref:Uncharacterized protein n=1 Tax=Tahibacter amnicola TaxID=2976241 RepID=A0ABY6BB44_9GAMM|nr:hypothetical protein [Tahibacter amnicola]UXI66373.1 hypothetical protein N4264_16640 [Tahibacter amnicola]
MTEAETRLYTTGAPHDRFSIETRLRRRAQSLADESGEPATIYTCKGEHVVAVCRPGEAEPRQEAGAPGPDDDGPGL